jgi:hypothetical protein
VGCDDASPKTVVLEALRCAQGLRQGGVVLFIFRATQAGLAAKKTAAKADRDFKQTELLDRRDDI